MPRHRAERTAGFVRHASAGGRLLCHELDRAGTPRREDRVDGQHGASSRVSSDALRRHGLCRRRARELTESGDAQPAEAGQTPGSTLFPAMPALRVLRLRR